MEIVEVIKDFGKQKKGMVIEMPDVFLEKNIKLGRIKRTDRPISKPKASKKKGAKE